ncbi:MAG: hypothetical protein FWC84_07995 [Alphaproteobacteria bacterium]|nr:hypothetical protein [Alphaproteobacteria bacterium]
MTAERLISGRVTTCVSKEKFFKEQLLASFDLASGKVCGDSSAEGSQP